MAVQCRRGPWKDFHPEKLRPGEWAFVTSGDPNSESGRSVYACFAPGVVKRMSTYEDMQLNIQNATEEVRDLFTKDIQDAISDAVAATKSANDIVDLLERKLENGDFVGPQGEEGQPGPPGPAGSIENIENATVEFTQGSDRNNIISGEKISIILGKIQKWFADLKSAAFYSVVNGVTQTKAGEAVLDAAVGKYLDEKKFDVSKIIASRTITEYGFAMDGKTVADWLSELNSNKQDKLIRGNNTYADIDKYLDGAYWFNADKITSGTVPFSSYGFIFSLRAETNTYFQIAIPYSNTADKPKYRTHANGSWQPWKDF